METCAEGHDLSVASYRLTCKDCNRLNAKKFRDADPEKYRRIKNEAQLRRLYGIQSLEHRDTILASQGNACAICRRTDCHWGRGFMDTWHIDHDPAKPGTYRGILCAFCNTALGRLEKFLPSVIKYVEQRAAQRATKMMLWTKEDL